MLLVVALTLGLVLHLIRGVIIGLKIGVDDWWYEVQAIKRRGFHGN